MNNPNVVKENFEGSYILKLDDVLFSQRKLFLTEDVNVDTTSELIKQFLYLDSVAPDKEITFYINSPGGEVNAGLCLYNVIRNCKAPITTVCTGTAASMGAILFMAGGKRKMLADSLIMIHDPSTYFRMQHAKVGYVQNVLDNLLALKERLAGIIAERSGHTIDEIYEKTCKDTYFSADEAIKFGLATEKIQED
jgi:ATP-dependent Clp protease protease subunit